MIIIIMTIIIIIIIMIIIIIIIIILLLSLLLSLFCLKWIMLMIKEYCYTQWPGLVSQQVRT